jgi:NADH-quinone oxidoreductase subunit C
MSADMHETTSCAPGTDPVFLRRLEAKLERAGAVCESRARRQAVFRVSQERLVPLLRELIRTEDGRLATITGIDVRDGTELIYHLCFDGPRFVANLKILVPRSSDTMESITPWLPGAEFIEREIHDLLGLNFAGHPRMKRLILSDDWPEGVYPLRRGFSKQDARPPRVEDT